MERIRKGKINNKICYITVLQNHCTFSPAFAQVIIALLILPPTTCTIEKMLSTLRRVKTWIRPFITKERLNGRSLLSVNRERASRQKHQLTEDIITDLGEEKKYL